MHLRTVFVALLLGAQTLTAQDTAAARAVLQRAKPDIRDTIDKDKSRPSYVQRAQTRALAKIDSAIAFLKTVAPPAGPVAATIAIHAPTQNLSVGGTLTLIAEVRDATNVVIPGAPVSWSTTTSAVADLSALGVLTGKTGGTATATARSGNVFTSRDFTVIGSAPVPVDTTTTKPPVDTTTTTTNTPTIVAEKPRVTPSEPYPAVSRQVRIPSGTDLQAALNTAQPGDELLLAPGAVFAGNFILPNKGASTSWIVVRTDVTDAQLGAIGNRMTPLKSNTLRLAQIRATFNASAFMTAPGAHHWRLTGLDMGGAPTASDISGIVRFGTWDAQEPTAASQAHHLVIDRSYIHGTPTQAIRRCIFLSSGYAIVKDSWMSDCHSNNGDSQALLAVGGSGPYLLDNNTFSGGHEVIMFGGGDPYIKNLLPADITITHNDITRPVTDLGVWGVKNLLELKYGTRFLISGNVMHNNWNDAQTGFGLLGKSVNQEGTCPTCGTTDVTIQFNILRNSGAGMNYAGHPETSPVTSAARFTVTDNLTDSLNIGSYAGPGIPLQLLAGMSDLLLVHNTFARGTGNTVMMDGDPMIRLSLVANAFAESGYGMRGSGSGTGTSGFEMFAPGYVFRDNVNVYATCSQYPATTICPSSWPATMPTAPSDGKPIGANLAAITSATAGVVVPSGLAALRRGAVTARQTGWKPTSPAQRKINDHR